MGKLSLARAGVAILPNLELLHRGKVRDTYRLSGNRLLQVATDGISIFDFVLNALVPQKGFILTAMTDFWTHHLGRFGINTHLVASGCRIDDFLPPELRGDIDLQSRALVVRAMDMVPVEFIARGVLTGSAVGEYKKNKGVCGHLLPADLKDGDDLPCVLDTPTTKEECGHDQNLGAAAVREKYPNQTYQLLRVFQIASAFARENGIKLADTKLEFGNDGTIGDEILTPDSTRYWEFAEWERSRRIAGDRKPPSPYDKQFVRAWGIGEGVNTKNPDNEADVEWVHSLVVPPAVIRKTVQIYRYIFWRLTGSTIGSYLCNVMGVSVPGRAFPRIAIICGSESDLPLVKEAFLGLDLIEKIPVHVVSCHRNSQALRDFVEGQDSPDIVIGIGSKALALPGMVAAFAAAAGKSLRVVGVALGEPGSRELEAARLSIEELPGTPVILDEETGHCYEGVAGIRKAVTRCAFGELPPEKNQILKPERMNVQL